MIVSSLDLPRNKRFKYLGSLLSANGEMCCGIAAHISATWMKWRSTAGVLCDRHPRTSQILNLPECWPTIKNNERHLVVMVSPLDIALDQWRNTTWPHQIDMELIRSYRDCETGVFHDVDTQFQDWIRKDQKANLYNVVLQTPFRSRT